MFFKLIEEIRKSFYRRKLTVMSNKNIYLGLAGDVMIGRGVNEVISRKGYLYPWGNILEILRRTDINIVNLETALTNSNQEVPKVFNFKASPDKVKTLAEARITAVSLANNHILDFSEKGMVETMHTLQAAGIKYAGAGLNEEEAAQPAIIVKNNFRLGLLSFTDNERSWAARPNYSGINYIDISNSNDKRRALSSVKQLRKDVDVLVVSLHWGPNMREEPSAPFVDFAHQLVEEGGDIIHGHSAHIFQAIEVYRNKLILYDTGDFVDDYALNPLLRNDLSFFFLVELNKSKIISLKLIPVTISNYQVNKAINKDYTWSIKHIQQLSAKFSTIVSDEGEIRLT